MSDIRADDATDHNSMEEDRLPWLEAVDEDDESHGPSAAKLIAAVVIGLVCIGLVVGGLFWLGNRGSDTGTGEPELIAAPEGDYKVPPDDPGGMNVEGQGETAFAASEGAIPKGEIDTSRVPEAPVTKEQPKAAAPKQAEAAPKQESSPAPQAAGATIQLGAFSSQAAAQGAWKAMSGRFNYLAPLSHNVTSVESGGRTLYRLRASGPDARGICGRLRVAGESCVVID